MTRPVSRRQLLRGLGVVGGAGLLGGAAANALASGPVQVISRTPSGYQPFLWSDPRAWPAGRVPGPTDDAVVDGTMVLDEAIDVGRVTIRPRGNLVFNPQRSVALRARGNVVVEGRLTMRPATPDVSHTVTFLDVNEARFVGGGMTVVDRDTGLWVVGAGALDAIGATRLPWTRLAGSLSAGTRTLALAQDPTGWRRGDELVVTPTLPPAVQNYTEAYDVVRIASINGREIVTDSAMRFDHPVVRPGQGHVIGAEVLNLTRNVVVGGTSRGRSHIFIHTRVPQTIRNVRVEHVGPYRHDGVVDGDGRPVATPVLGRYGLHFHHCADGSRGSLVDGVVITNAGSHAFVPHTSHGVTFRGCVAHNTQLAQYWWDVGHRTDNTVYDRCVGSAMRNIAAKGLMRDANGVPVTTAFQFLIGPFELQAGAGNVVRHCVAVGTRSGVDSAGFMWNKDTSGNWAFDSCVSHNNNMHGTLAWLNDDVRHVVHGLVAYHNGHSGIKHGAYLNNFVYTRAVSYGNGVCALDLHANSRTPPGRQTWIDCTFDAASRAHAVYANKHNSGTGTSGTTLPVRFVRCDLKGATVAAVGRRQGTSHFELDAYDFEHCVFDGNEFLMGQAHQSTVWRVHDAPRGTVALRRAGSAGQYHQGWDAAVAAIAPFAGSAPHTSAAELHLPAPTER